jgi:hypothetical protein
MPQKIAMVEADVEHCLPLGTGTKIHGSIVGDDFSASKKSQASA